MKQLWLLLLLSSVIGCQDQNNKQTWQPINPTDSRVLAESMVDIPLTDLEVLYKQYSGISEYLKNAKNSFESTIEVEKTIVRFQTDYSYTPGRYQKFSDEFQKYMNARGYFTGEDAKSVVDKVEDDSTQILKSKLIEDMQTVADAVRLAIEAKNVKP